MLNCLDCGKPWGVILERGELPSPEAQRLAQQEMMDELDDAIYFDFEYEIDISRLPQVVAVEVVYLTESTCNFASEKFDGCVPEGPCWVDLKNCDIPDWLLKSRKRRWAYRWDCCNLDLLNSGVVKEVIAQ